MALVRFFDVGFLIVDDFSRNSKTIFDAISKWFSKSADRIFADVEFLVKNSHPDWRYDGFAVSSRKRFFAPRKTGRFAYGLTDYTIKFSVDPEFCHKNSSTRGFASKTWCYVGSRVVRNGFPT